MAKQRMVTRSAHITYATILAVNLETEQTEQIVAELHHIYKDDNAILKDAAKTVDSKYRLVHVIECDVQDKLFGCTEDEFFAIAKELPARVKSTINE